MKRLIAAAAVLAVGVSIAVTSIGGAQTPTGERTLKFVEKGGSASFVDNPPRATKRHPHAESAGDEFLFDSGLYDASNKRAGAVYGDCHKATGKNALFVCTGEGKLADGTISFSGLINESSMKQTLSVIGGTGAYEGVRGSISSVDRSKADNSPSDDTIHLLG